MHSLEGKTAVVIGGTSGIGLAVARNFAENGAKVIVCGRRSVDDEGLLSMSVDVTDQKGVEKLFDDIETSHGKFDILINNAGIAEDVGSMEESPTGFMRRCLDVNLMGVYFGMKYGPKHMNDGGSVINTGSTAGSGLTTFGYAEYAASKAGVAYVTRTAAIELAPRGIRVNAVCPALIQGTGMMQEDDGGPELELYRRLTAFGRMGTLGEVVGIYNFLAGDASTFITGQEIRVDGGQTAGIGLPMLEKLGA